MGEFFFKRSDAVLQSVFLHFLYAFDSLYFPLFVFQEFFQVSDLCIIELFWVILTASDILKLIK